MWENKNLKISDMLGKGVGVSRMGGGGQPSCELWCNYNSNNVFILPNFNYGFSFLFQHL